MQGMRNKRQLMKGRGKGKIVVGQNERHPKTIRQVSFTLKRKKAGGSKGKMRKRREEMKAGHERKSRGE